MHRFFTINKCMDRKVTVHHDHNWNDKYNETLNNRSLVGIFGTPYETKKLLNYLNDTLQNSYL
jgi:hypothetical protein